MSDRPLPKSSCLGCARNERHAGIDLERGSRSWAWPVTPLAWRTVQMRGQCLTVRGALVAATIDQECFGRQAGCYTERTERYHNRGAHWNGRPEVLDQSGYRQLELKAGPFRYGNPRSLHANDSWRGFLSRDDRRIRNRSDRVLAQHKDATSRLTAARVSASGLLSTLNQAQRWGAAQVPLTAVGGCACGDEVVRMAVIATRSA